MAQQMPLIPLLTDIQSLPLAQLQAYCKAYELPTANITMDNMRANLQAVCFIAHGNVLQVTTAERLTLFNAWGLAGDYSTATPDQVLIPVIGYWHAMVMRYQAIGYARNAHSVIDNGSQQTFYTGTGSCDITVTVDQE